MRTCVGCRAARPKRELARLARTPQGVRYDPTGNLPGRGAYLCPRTSCITAARRRDAGAVRRALKGVATSEVVAALDALETRSVPDPGQDHQQGVHHQVPDGTVRSENA